MLVIWDFEKKPLLRGFHKKENFNYIGNIFELGFKDNFKDQIGGFLYVHYDAEYISFDISTFTEVPP